MSLKSSFRLFLPLLLLGALNGCDWLDDWFPPDQPQGNPVDEKKLAELNRFRYEQMAPEAPPPPQMEIPTPRPEPADEYAWRPGYWEYHDLTGWSWKSGYWIKKPAFTAVWKPDFWTHHTYGWALVPGHWE